MSVVAAGVGRKDSAAPAQPQLTSIDDLVRPVAARPAPIVVPEPRPALPEPTEDELMLLIQRPVIHATSAIEAPLPLRDDFGRKPTLFERMMSGSGAPRPVARRQAA